MILLMFGVGLHFHVKELLAVKRVAIPGAILQSAAATGLGALAGRAFGWSWTSGIVLGLAIAVASTVVLTRVLEDNRALHTKTGHIAIGWLVVEDLFTVLVLVLLPVTVGENAGGDLVAIAGSIGDCIAQGRGARCIHVSVRRTRAADALALRRQDRAHASCSR